MVCSTSATATKSLASTCSPTVTFSLMSGRPMRAHSASSVSSTTGIAKSSSVRKMSSAVLAQPLRPTPMAPHASPITPNTRSRSRAPTENGRTGTQPGPPTQSRTLKPTFTTAASGTLLRSIPGSINVLSKSKDKAYESMSHT